MPPPWKIRLIFSVLSKPERRLCQAKVPNLLNFLMRLLLKYCPPQRITNQLLKGIDPFLLSELKLPDRARSVSPKIVVRRGALRNYIRYTILTTLPCLPSSSHSMWSRFSRPRHLKNAPTSY